MNDASESCFSSQKKKKGIHLIQLLALLSSFGSQKAFHPHLILPFVFCRKLDAFWCVKCTLRAFLKVDSGWIGSVGKRKTWRNGTLEVLICLKAHEFSPQIELFRQILVYTVKWHFLEMWHNPYLILWSLGFIRTSRTRWKLLASSHVLVATRKVSFTCPSLISSMPTIRHK